MPKAQVTPQNLYVVVEKQMGEIEATKDKFNEQIAASLRREAMLWEHLNATTAKLNDALARIEKLEKKTDGRTTAKDVLFAKDAANYIGLESVNSIYQKVSDGQIRAIKHKGGRMRFQVSDLQAYLLNKRNNLL